MVFFFFFFDFGLVLFVSGLCLLTRVYYRHDDDVHHSMAGEAFGITTHVYIYVYIHIFFLTLRDDTFSRLLLFRWRKMMPRKQRS